MSVLYKLYDHSLVLIFSGGNASSPVREWKNSLKTHMHTECVIWVRKKRKALAREPNLGYYTGISDMNKCSPAFWRLLIKGLIIYSTKYVASDWSMTNA